MRANAPLYSLNAGEVSKIALARVDVAKLRMAAACQVNWLPYVVGPMAMRPGLYYVGGVNGASQTRLLPFVYAKTDTALIELTAPPGGVLTAAEAFGLGCIEDLFDPASYP